jgi:dimethylargininase
MSSRSYRFTHAVTRAPGAAVTQGLRDVDTGAPDLRLFQAHHAAYIAALRATGAEVTELPALDTFPDGVFVEDTALCLPEGAVILRPGAPSRLGEAAAMAPTLAQHYGKVLAIETGFIEGGDILVTEREILAPWDYSVRELQTPPGVLHFKTDCSLLDEETILATPRLAASGCFEGYWVILTAEGEEAAANSIRFNDVVLVPEGFPATAGMLAKAGYDLRGIPNTEAAKLDGGMSCLSLRFTPPG